jgi:hypothetical protein
MCHISPNRVAETKNRPRDGEVAGKPNKNTGIAGGLQWDGVGKSPARQLIFLFD